MKLIKKQGFSPEICFSKFPLLILFFVFAFFSCKKTDQNSIPPTIQFNADSSYISKDTTVLIGKNFKVGITASKGDVNITNFIIKYNNDAEQTYLDSGLNSSSFSLTKILTKGVSKSEIWTFTVRDKNGKTASVYLKILADSSSQFGTVITIPSIVFGAQNNSNIGSFFDVKNNKIHHLAEAFNIQDSIELCYYYDFLQGENNVIASPGANIDASVYTGQYALTNWTIKHETRFIETTLTANDFNNIKNDSLLIALYNVPLAKRKAKNLAVGKIFSFKTSSGKFGIFKVISVNGTGGGTVEIEIKIQE